MVEPKTPAPSRLEQVARPLLQLVRHLTGMETAFVTGIDWENQRQDVLFSLNTGRIRVAEGSAVDWKESMCRSMFLSGRAQSGDVAAEIARPTALALGMKSFFAVPILVDDATIGTVCGGSEAHIVLDDHQVGAMQMIADAMQQLMHAEVAAGQAIARAEYAESEVIHHRREAEGHATAARHMERLAHTDALTSLPNRRAFTIRWEDELARSGRKHHDIGLLMIDVDRFKQVNDTLGHAAGDAVLSALGLILRTAAHGAALPVRLGGDEFALAMTHTGMVDIMALAEQIRTRFASVTTELGAAATLSIGVATSETCARDDLLTAADLALYRSKAAGGNRVHVWDGDLLESD